jgi:hypothetical protein
VTLKHDNLNKVLTCASHLWVLSCWVYSFLRAWKPGYSSVSAIILRRNTVLPHASHNHKLVFN